MMEGASGPYNPRTAEEVFKDFRGRRAGMIKALTTDVDKFYQQCDPGAVFYLHVLTTIGLHLLRPRQLLATIGERGWSTLAPGKAVSVAN
ncbi:hypothetical protein Taro_012192 [Colocasia esculenta]|uniref:PHD finger protein ALFIN-LIKE n=1 Tax=Colocasia esculenta TaxID=4460 RepID=A0A843UCX1_COLES|nr:hypothetical protein [Colocasia esculenta]